jgi:hypothetical protein
MAYLPLATLIVAIVGFYIVHRLTLSRTQRDEIFKLCDATRALIVEVSQQATDYWGADKDDALTYRRIIGRVSFISARAEALRRRNPKFDLAEEVAAFRRAATADIEARPDGERLRRTVEIGHKAILLDDKIDRLFVTLYC